MELLYEEIKLPTKIKQKTMPQSLISKVRLEECLEARKGKSSAIIIMVGNKIEVSGLCAKEIRFGRASQVVEKC